VLLSATSFAGSVRPLAVRDQRQPSGSRSGDAARQRRRRSRSAPRRSTVCWRSEDDRRPARRAAGGQASAVASEAAALSNSTRRGRALSPGCPIGEAAPSGDLLDRPHLPGRRASCGAWAGRSWARWASRDATRAWWPWCRGRWPSSPRPRGTAGHHVSHAGVDALQRLGGAQLRLGRTGLRPRASPFAGAWTGTVTGGSCRRWRVRRCHDHRPRHQRLVVVPGMRRRNVRRRMVPKVEANYSTYAGSDAASSQLSRAG
jgi:hypothetical protein